MSNNGKLGERLFSQYMQSYGYGVQDVSTDSYYFDKDIDFIITSPTTGAKKYFEVKWDEKINSTGNLFLELENPRSKQWGGQGWYPNCKADFLVYGDAIAKKFYIVTLDQLQERVKRLDLTWKRTRDGAAGWLLPKDYIKDLYTEINVDF